MNIIEKAVRISVEAHQNQTRKGNDLPFIFIHLWWRSNWQSIIFQIRLLWRPWHTMFWRTQIILKRS